MNREAIMDNLPLVLLFIALGVIQFVNQIYPEYAQITGLFASGGIFLIMGIIIAYAKVIATQYSYLEAITYPSKQKLKIYIAENGIETKKVGKKDNPSPLFSTTITPRYACSFKPIGKIKRLHIHHEHTLANRLDWKPGKADFQGQMVSHPFTETVILYETDKIAMNKTDPEPVFILAHAGKDYARAKQGFKEENWEKFLTSETDRENKELRQQNVEITQVHEKVKDMFSGTQRAGAKGTDLVYEVMNDILSLCVTIERAVKSRPFRILTLPFTLLLLGLVVVVTAVTVWLRPDIITGIGMFFSTTMGVVALIAIGVFGLLLLYFIVRRRRM